MNDLTAYLYAVLGVAVAVVLPVLAGYIKQQFPHPLRAGLPLWVKRYLALLIFSMIVALATLAIWKSQNPDAQLHWFTAFLLGFGWESAIEKFFNPSAKP